MATLPRQVVIPLIVACALFMENLDSTVLATALPAIAQSLGESPLRLSLAITSYLFSLAVFIPASGWVADRFGARRVFRLAILVFLAGSILCGLSSSLLGFVLARIFQGMGGAMMVPVGRLVVLRSLPKTGLINALAYLTVPALVGPVLGPPLGGFITTYVSWRWIFWINVPIGVLGVILATLFIPDMREEAVPPLDLPGFFLTALGLTGLVFGFEAAGRDVVPLPSVISLLAAGAISLALYIRYARRAAHPIIDLSLLRIPFPRRHRRRALPAAPHAAGGLRAHALPIGPPHLRLGRGGAHHEIHRSTDPAPPRLPPRAHRECGVERSASRPLWPLPRRYAGGADLRPAAHRRLLPLAAIHQRQRPRLCRGPPCAHEPCHQRLGDGAAALAQHRRRLRRPAAPPHHGPARRRPSRRRRFHAGLLRRRRRGRPLGARLSRAADRGGSRAGASGARGLAYAAAFGAVARAAGAGRGLSAKGAVFRGAPRRANFFGRFRLTRLGPLSSMQTIKHEQCD